MSNDDYAYTREARTVIEYGVVFDCEAQGCPEPHSDRNMVVSLERYKHGRPTKVNNHAVRNVIRTVEYGAWLDEDSPVTASTASPQASQALNPPTDSPNTQETK